MQPDRRVARLAHHQYGVVTRRQLIDAGLTASSIDRRIAAGRLLPVHRAVYAVGHRRLVAEGRWLAAVLACGSGAVLSHRSAGVAWGLLKPGADAIASVTVERQAGRKQARIEAHRCRLAAEEVTRRRGMPTTTPARTLLDLGDVLPAAAVRRALEEAQRLRIYDGPALEAVLARAAGRRGRGMLQRALAEVDPLTARTRSELERRALRLIADHELPRPRVNVRLHGYEVDLLWPEAKVVAELDGFVYHASRSAFERDRRRDAALQAAGYRVQRFSWTQVVREPDRVVACLRALL